MGSFCVYCHISNLSIDEGDECVLLPLKKNKSYLYSRSEWLPATLPIFGTYNGYGRLVNIVKDDNTKLIESYFGISIDEFCELLVYSNNKEVSEDKVKLQEIKEWVFDDDDWNRLTKELDEFENTEEYRSAIQTKYTNLVEFMQRNLDCFGTLNEQRNTCTYPIVKPSEPNFSINYYGVDRLLFLDSICELVLVSDSIRAISKFFSPHIRHVTPTYAQLSQEAKLLSKFSEIANQRISS